jgi:hypothetical protein
MDTQIPEELIQAARNAAANLFEFRMAEVRRQYLERVVTEYIIRLGLAKNADDAQHVSLEDILKAERERAGS